LVCITHSLSAQKIEGYVVDAKSEEPVPYANVYFANTTIGTATDENGYFIITNFDPGKYDLTVSFVGYKIYSRPVQVKESESYSIKILLEEKLVELPELFVMADTSNWADNFSVFREYFIGLTEASPGCKIKNKKSLVFYFDDNSKVLYAHAREPIVIENKWLGYKITYDLQSFSVNLKKGQLAYYGVPRFSSLTSKKKRVEKRWIKQRDKSYWGSSLHFFRSVYQTKINDNGFDIYEMHRIINPERPPDSTLEKILDDLKKKIAAKANKNSFTIREFGSQPETLEDSLVYFSRLKKKPQYKDSIGRNFKNGEALINDAGKVDFSGRLLVFYKDNVPDDYPWKRNKDLDEKQKTILHIAKPITVYGNGYYDSVKDTFVEGYWSWTGNLATLLPLDYYPEN